MRAAVVREFDRPPRYEVLDAPEPSGEHEELIDVVAAGLHPRVRSQANGSHYTSTDELPLVPGIDGVGRRTDGSLVYFILPDTTRGSMADQTVVDLRRSVPLRPDADAVVLAAAMNPAMSSWVALQRRITFRPGQAVLILGGTGSAGQLAIQITRHLGASQVIAAGRGAEKLAALPALGADHTIDLARDPEHVARDLAAHAADVDVVLDYLWGPPAESAILPLVRGRPNRSKALNWIQIGAVAGPDIRLQSAALRQANLQLLGSGQGSVGAAEILAVLPSLVTEIDGGTFTVDADTRPLAEVEAVWTETPGRATGRLVLQP